MSSCCPRSVVTATASSSSSSSAPYYMSGATGAPNANAQPPSSPPAAEIGTVLTTGCPIWSWTWIGFVGVPPSLALDQPTFCTIRIGQTVEESNFKLTKSTQSASRLDILNRDETTVEIVYRVTGYRLNPETGNRVGILWNKWLLSRYCGATGYRVNLEIG